MVAHNKIFQTLFYSCSCHFFYGIAAIAPVTMAMYNSSDIGGLNYSWVKCLFWLFL